MTKEKTILRKSRKGATSKTRLGSKAKPVERKSTRKDKVFSVSVREAELEEIEFFIKDINQGSVYGGSVSRNELFRRATLAHVRYMEALMNKEKVDYYDVFKSIGV